MGNPFDQFDQQGGNPFDQFDNAPSAADPLGITQKEQPNVWADMGLSGLSGVARGALSGILTAALTPGDVPIFSEEQSRGMYDAGNQMMNDNLYAPKTMPGKFAETAGTLVPFAAMPSAAVRNAPTALRAAGEYGSELLGNVIAPAVVSEGAGQTVQALGGGPNYEMAARILGLVGGNLGVAGARASVAPENVLRRAAGDVSEADWQRAIDLQNNTTGVKLTGPEALTQAKGGASGLPAVQRVVEGSIDGQTKMAPFFAQRPEQLKTATNNWLDTIAPQSDAPSTLGPRVAQAADAALKAGPEGQALQDAIFGAGPRLTDMQAGEILQPALKGVYDRREGMRNALADQGFEAARQSPPTVEVAGLPALSTTTNPAYTSIEARTMGSPEHVMVPKDVPAKTEMPSLTSRTGPEKIQVDARPVVQFIDDTMTTARGNTQAALRRVRDTMHVNGGVDTSVGGLDGARGAIQAEIAAAKDAGDLATVTALERTRDQLDAALQTVPGYKSAVDTFKAASAPLEPFNSPGMGKAIARDQFNTKFTTAPEDVPGALRTPSDAKAFGSVAPPDARVAMENSLATHLMDKATNADGTVNADALARAMRDSADLLAQFPAVADRLNTVVSASGKAAAARVGPLADVAAAKDTITAGNALLGPRAHVGSETEIGDALTRLVLQDPEATKGLVRQNFADRFNHAATETQTGDSSRAGTKFHQDLTGNPQRKATLDAALAAIGAPVDVAKNMLDVFQATGRRLPIGSATEFNRSINADMGIRSAPGRAVDLLKTAGTSFFANASDAVKRAALRHSLGTLSDMFTHPQAVELMRAAIERGAPTVVPEALLRSVFQAPAEANR